MKYSSEAVNCDNLDLIQTNFVQGNGLNHLETWTVRVDKYIPLPILLCIFFLLLSRGSSFKAVIGGFLITFAL